MADLPKDFSPSHSDWGVPSKMARWRLQGGDKLRQAQRADKVVKLNTSHDESPSHEESGLITGEFEQNKLVEQAKTVYTPRSPLRSSGVLSQPAIDKSLSQPTPKRKTIKKGSTRGQSAKLSKKGQKSRSN